MTKIQLPSIDDIRTLLEYNPSIGIFTWRTRSVDTFEAKNTIRAMRSWNARYAGQPAMNNNTARGYLSGMIRGKRVAAHRIAWAHHYGEWPNGEIDHINGDGLDNRISNLRIATSAQNQRNVKRRSKRKYPRSEKRGAHWHKGNGRWSSSIRIHLGYFDTEEEASAAYEKAAKEIHQDFYLKDGVRRDS